MYLMIDNKDSFVYNLVAYFRELGAEVLVRTNDEITLEECARLEQLEGIILSPGPGKPKEAGNCPMIFDGMRGIVPILGVCLGHQLIGEYYGLNLKKGKRPKHGKISKFYHNGEGLFEDLPTSFRITRYHSLILWESQKECGIQIDGRTEDHVIMSIRDEREGVYGVQFHPESVTTQYGHEILHQFMKICEKWRRKDEINSKRA